MDIDLNNDPLVWTTKGNLRVSDLTYSVEWEDTEDYTKFTEFHRLGDEIVRCSSHVRAKKGALFAGEQAGS